MSHEKPFVYLDHNATTPVCKEVQMALPELVQAWGNPSSIHWLGRLPKNILRDTRKELADSLGVSPLEIVFTSGGSESNNAVIRGVFEYLQTSPYVSSGQKNRRHFMCSQVEHPSVMKAFQHLESLGAEVDFIPVNRQGEIDLDFYKAHLSPETALVSVMLANNETGTIFPIQEMSKLAHGQGALFHTDAVQAFGKISVNLAELEVDFASFSAHKVYSIKGTGFLYSKKNSHFVPQVIGGGQERHRRGGTENVLGIGALGLAAKKLQNVKLKAVELESLRNYLEQRIQAEVSDVTITAAESLRLPNTSSLVIKNADGETLLMSLDIEGYAVSTGAACSSGNPEPSPVLLAMGLTRAEAQNSLRLSLGWDTTKNEIDQFIEVLKKVVQRLRDLQEEEVKGENNHA